MTTERAQCSLEYKGSCSNPIQECVLKEHLPAYVQAAEEFSIKINIVPAGEAFGTTENGTALVADEDHVGINYYAIHPYDSNGSRYDFSGFGVRVRELVAQIENK